MTENKTTFHTGQILYLRDKDKIPFKVIVKTPGDGSVESPCMVCYPHDEEEEKYTYRKWVTDPNDLIFDLDFTPSTNDQFMIIAAVRYCLTRSSYAVEIASNWVKSIWEKIAYDTKNILIKDIFLELMENRIKHKVDKVIWLELSSWMWSNVNEEDKNWVRRALNYKKSPLPIDLDPKKVLDHYSDN